VLNLREKGFNFVGFIPWDALIEKGRTREGGGRFFLLKSKQRLKGFFFFKFDFFFEGEHFSNFAAQNDIVLPIPSILMVFPNGGGQIVRGW
jgi:hypothetical protein